MGVHSAQIEHGTGEQILLKTLQSGAVHIREAELSVIDDLQKIVCTGGIEERGDALHGVKLCAASRQPRHTEHDPFDRCFRGLEQEIPIAVL